MTRGLVGGEGGWSTGRYRFITVCSVMIAGLMIVSRFLANNSYSATSIPLRKAIRGPLKRVILLSSQDTGSTWLNSVLNGVDGVSFRGERLIAYSHKSYHDWLERDWQYYRKQLETALEVEESDGDVELVGFKLMYDQLPQQMHRPFAQWLNDNQIYVIHLRRRAAILQWASHNQKVHAMMSGSMKDDHVSDKDAVVEYPAIKFHAARDIPRIRQLEQNQRDFADYLHVHAPLAPQMELWYELLDGPHKSKWFNALFAFLGLDQKMTDDVGSDFIKLGKRKCDDRIDGFQGPDYKNLQGLESQMACAMLYWSSENETELGYSQSFYPPENDKCQLTPALTMKCLDPAYNASAGPGKL